MPYFAARTTRSRIVLSCASALLPCGRLLMELRRSYVIGALQADTTLPYSMAALKDLVQLEAGSWVRHRDWILRQVKA